jgi:hypothetical protein
VKAELGVVSGLGSGRGLARQILRFELDDLERIAGRAGRYYRPFDRRNDRRPKWRHIDNPVGVLKGIQKRIQREILAQLPQQPEIRGDFGYPVPAPVVW